MRNSLCSHRAGQPVSTQCSQGSTEEGEEKANAAGSAEITVRGLPMGDEASHPCWLSLPALLGRDARQPHSQLSSALLYQDNECITQREADTAAAHLDFERLCQSWRSICDLHTLLPLWESNTLSMLDDTQAVAHSTNLISLQLQEDIFPNRKKEGKTRYFPG